MKSTAIRLFRFLFTLFFNLIFTLLFTSHVSAKVYHWPEVCESGTLSIHNPGSEDAHFYLQTFHPYLKSEEPITVEPRSDFSIDVSGFSSIHPLRRLSLLQMSSDSALIKVSFRCGHQNFAASSYQSGEWTFNKNASLKTHKLWIKNLSDTLSTYEIRVYKANDQVYNSWKIDFQPFEQKSLVLKSSDQWQYFKFKSNKKVSLFYLDQYRTALPTDFKSVAFKDVNPIGVYFEVQNREKNEDSFVVHITDPEMIQRARTILNTPDSEKIVVGEIKMGANSHNRNLHSIDRAPWSWHVSRVTNFSDFGSTACNGIPQIVEDRIPLWTQDPGRICFWSYRLKREVPWTEL